jgi:hypothetical protein
MKTRNHIQRLVKSITITGIIVIFNTGLNAQPRTTDREPDPETVYARIDERILSVEKSVMYVAPEVLTEVENSIRNLELVITNTEKEIQYRAPEVSVQTENKFAGISEAISRIETIINATEVMVSYEAPDADKFTGTPENEYAVRNVQVIPDSPVYDIPVTRVAYDIIAR